MSMYIESWVIYSPAENTRTRLSYPFLQTLKPDDSIDETLQANRDTVAEYFQGCVIHSSHYRTGKNSKEAK